MARRRVDPGLHVYHYAAYEHTALGRLAQRYGTRETEVDDLLRGKVLVDLYRVVRQGLRIGVESYSIKRLEHLYGFHRTQDMRDANSSIVAFEEWLELEPDKAAEAGPAILDDIVGYNRDDVISTWKLRDWLEERRVDLERREGGPLPRLEEPGDGEAPAARRARPRGGGARGAPHGGPAGGPGDACTGPGGRRSVDARPAAWLAPARGAVRVLALPRADGHVRRGAHRRA